MTAVGDTAGLEEPHTNLVSLCLGQHLKREAVAALQKSSIQRSCFHHLHLHNVFPVEVQILVQ